MSKDEEILNIISRDAKISTKELAKIVGIPEKDVKARIKKFEENGVIVKYKTVINWEKMDKEPVYAMVDLKVTPEREKGYDSIAERIMKFPEVKTLYLVSGLYDLSVMVEGSSMKEVASFVAEKVAPLDQIQSTTTHFILKRFKEDGDILQGEEKLKRLPITP